MPDAVEEIRAAIESVVIRSPGELLIDGEVCRVPDPIVLYQMNAAAFGSSPMLALLQTQVYARLYGRNARSGMPGEDLTPILSAANRGRDRWEEGWIVIDGAPGGMITAVRDDVTTNLLPSQYVIPPGGTAAPGTSLTALMVREATNWQEGFYYTLSEVPIDVRDESRMMRIYWNVNESGAAPLVSAISEILNAFRIPFRFKVLNRSGVFGRADAAVIFAARRWFSAIAELLPRVIERVKEHLGEATPLMARRIGRGVSVAEDPGTAGDSFGTHRARLLATAIWTAYTRGSQDAEARMQVLEELFRTNGLRLDRPHLNPGSSDLYAAAAEA